MSFSQLPALNAALNGTSTLLLITGFVFIRRKNVAAHKACMLSACAVSILFLISYLTYHYMEGSTAFAGDGWVRVVYFSVLIPHTVLAGLAVLPLVIITVYQAVRGNFDKHRRIARWTFPIWLYVSITGVIIYWMLYHMPLAP